MMLEFGVSTTILAFHGGTISPHRIGKYSNVVALPLHKNVTDARLVRNLVKR